MIRDDIACVYPYPFVSDDPTVVEELPSESSATTEEAYSTAAHAVKL